MPNVIELKQGTEEWLKFRKSHITATDIAPIVGASPWDTNYTLYYGKQCDEIVMKTSNYIEWGSRLEPIIIDKVVEALDIKLVERGKCYEDGWKMASLDAEGEYFGDLPFGEHVIIEAKTTSHRDGWWDEDGKETIPLHYRLQAMWQMIVTGYRKVIFTVLCSGNDWWCRVFEYDEAIALDIQREALNFKQAIDEGVEPRAMSQVYAEAANAESQLRQKKLDEKNTKAEVDATIVNDFAVAQNKVKMAEVELGNAKNALLEALNGSRIATVKGEDAIKMVASGRGFKYIVL